MSSNEILEKMSWYKVKFHDFMIFFCDIECAKTEIQGIDYLSHIFWFSFSKEDTIQCCIKKPTAVLSAKYLRDSVTLHCFPGKPKILVLLLPLKTNNLSN